MVGVVLFLTLFYQIRLYADTFEQVYYLVASLYGWWWWARESRVGATSATRFRFSAPPILAGCAAITLVLSLALGYITARLHLWLPLFFPAPASFAYLDALTTIMSFAATILMAQKRIECWCYWIAVDVIGIGLYYAKDVVFIALLYVAFLLLATNGLLSWLGKHAEPSELVVV